MSDPLCGLWSLLRCPACGDRLATEVYSEHDGEPDYGLLRSTCGSWFPIVDRIPRMFIGEMRALYSRDFGSFLSRYGLKVGVRDLGRATRVTLATEESFGYEWLHFHEMLPEWEQNARFYFEPLGDLSALDGCLVLDSGAGKGRHAYYALKHGARVVALDVSRAIDVARRNCEGAGGEQLFVQADLMDPPFVDGTFDVAYAFGVLHHLPDPEAGFQRLVSLVSPGGRVLIYVYHAREDQPITRSLLRAVSCARVITTRLPHRLLLPLTTALGYGLYAGLVVPSRVLSRIPQLKRFATSLPLSSYARYSVRVLVNDQFDRFSAPIENRYRRDQVEAWLRHAGLQNVAVRGGAGWRAFGEKPRPRADSR